MRTPSFISFLILCFLGTPFLCRLQGSWERVLIPTQQSLHSLHFTDSLYGWVAGDSGTILHTTDGGNTWMVQQSMTSCEIADIFFLNHNLGWASAFNYSNPPFGTILLHTLDGGSTWIAEPYPQENIFIWSILFLDSLNGWMGGSPHALLRTTDGGLTWQQAVIDTSTLAFFPVLNLKFFGTEHGYACGGMFDIAGVIWRTHDGGDLWYAIDVTYAPADEVHGLFLFDSLHVMGSGGDPDFGYGVGIITTWDGGVTWDYLEPGIQGIAYDIDFRNGLEGWAPLGNNRRFMYTLDAGITWTELPTPDSTVIFKLMFTDSLHGFAAGKEGAVLRYIPPVFPGVTPYETEPRGLFCMNYPNPFYSSTTIRFVVPASAHADPWVRLVILNAFGWPVVTLTNEIYHPGTYDIGFDATHLPAGIYCGRLEVLYSGSETPQIFRNKMILLR